MVPSHSAVFSGNWRQVRGGILDGLDAGLLIVRQYGHQIRQWDAFSPPDLHLLIYMQHLHHLGVKVGVTPLQIVLNLVRM